MQQHSALHFVLRDGLAYPGELTFGVVAVRGAIEWQLRQLLLSRIDLLVCIELLTHQRLVLRFRAECGGFLLLHLQGGDEALGDKWPDAIEQLLRAVGLLLLKLQLPGDLHQLGAQQNDLAAQRSSLLQIELLLVGQIGLQTRTLRIQLLTDQRMRIAQRNAVLLAGNLQQRGHRHAPPAPRAPAGA